MSVYRRPGQETYSYDFRWRGRRFSGATGCATKREAERVEAERRIAARAAAIPQASPLNFRAAASRYWLEVGQFHKNDKDTLRTLHWLESAIGATTPLAEIGDERIAATVAAKRARGLAAATVNQSVGFPLRAILLRAARLWKQQTAEIEWRRHILRAPAERVREASAGEEERLMAAMRGDYAPALRFAILTGCRRMEIVGLTWQAVDFFSGRFTVDGKRGRSRTIPMSKAVRDLLWRLKDHHPAVVFTYAGRRGPDRGNRAPITLEGFKTEWRRARARAGITGLRFHDTRHTAATRLLRATGNLRLAKELLGHASIATTMRYAHVMDEDLRAGLEAVEAAKSPRKIPTETGDTQVNLLKKGDNRK